MGVRVVLPALLWLMGSAAGFNLQPNDRPKVNAKLPKQSRLDPSSLAKATTTPSNYVGPNTFNDFDISDVLAESEAALEVAEEVLTKNTKVEKKNEGDKAFTAAEQQEIAASAIGGAGLGLVLGSYALSQMPEIEQTVDPSLVPPTIAAVCGVASASGSRSKGVTGVLLRTVFGKTTIAIGNLIRQYVTDALNSIMSNAQSRVGKSKDDLMSLPSVAATKLQESSKEFADESIKSIEEAIQSYIPFSRRAPTMFSSTMDWATTPRKFLVTAFSWLERRLNPDAVQSDPVRKELPTTVAASTDYDGDASIDDTITSTPKKLFFALPFPQRRKKVNLFRPRPPATPPPLSLL